MDGKSFLCAFSVDLNLEQFGNTTEIQGLSELEMLKLLAKIPCKDLFGEGELRVAASQYIKCISQVGAVAPGPLPAIYKQRLSIAL